MNLLDDPHGGSLNSIAYDGPHVVKSYDGPIPRGHEKLQQEFTFLRDLPEAVAGRFGQLVSYREQFTPRRETTLTLLRHPEPSAAKALLSDLLTAERTARVVQTLGGVLLEELYPLARDVQDGHRVYEDYHGRRLTALDDLRRLPDLSPVCGAPRVFVNGTPCPSLPEIVGWLADCGRDAFTEPRTLVKAHLDAHLDNVLTTVSGPVALRFVDPRGERSGPPHYDWAKLLKSLRAHYHEIHYGLYALDVTSSDGACRVEMSVSDAYASCLSAGRTVLRGMTPAFASAEGVDVPTFVRGALVAELVHVISFSYYHAHRPEGRDTRRVLAYLTIASLLASRLMSGHDDLDSIAVPLLKGI